MSTTTTNGHKKRAVKYEVRVFTNEIASHCDALKNPNNYHLIDPCDAPQQTSPSVAHTIVVASSDLQYFHEFSKTAAKFFIPAWSFSELNAMRKHVLVHVGDSDIQKPLYRILTSDEFAHRFTMVGGRPRYLFADVYIYEGFIGEIDADIVGIYGPALVKAMNPRGSISHYYSGASKISSNLFVYSHALSTDRPYRYPGSRKLEIASEYIRLRLVAMYHHLLMDILNPNSSRHIFGVSKLVRSQVWKIWALTMLQAGGTFERKSLGTLSTPESETPLVLDKADFKYICDMTTVPRELEELSSRSKTRHLITDSNSILPVVDAMDRWDRIFHITMNPSQGIERESLLKMVKEAGYTEAHPLHLYHVVPDYGNDENDAFTRMDNYEDLPIGPAVKQYALKIPVSPSSKATKELLQNVKYYIGMLKACRK